MHNLSRQDMRRLGRCDPTVEILVKLDKLDIGFFKYAKPDPDFRMFLKCVVGIKGNVSSSMALKRTQDWACDAMYFIIMEERKEAEHKTEKKNSKQNSVSSSSSSPLALVQSAYVPRFYSDDLIAL